MPCGRGRNRTDSSDEEEWASIPPALFEVGVGEHEQRVTRSESYPTKLLSDAPTGTVDRNDGSLIAAAKARLYERAPNEG